MNIEEYPDMEHEKSCGCKIKIDDFNIVVENCSQHKGRYMIIQRR